MRGEGAWRAGRGLGRKRGEPCMGGVCGGLGGEGVCVFGGLGGEWRGGGEEGWVCVGGRGVWRAGCALEGGAS